MNNNKQPDSTMRAGAIVSIVSSALTIIIGIAYLTAWSEAEAVMNVRVFHGFFYYGIIMSVVSLILSSLLLSGHLHSAIAPGVVAIIAGLPTIISLIGGILMLCGKFIDKPASAPSSSSYPSSTSSQN